MNFTGELCPIKKIEVSGRLWTGASPLVKCHCESLSLASKLPDSTSILEFGSQLV